MRGRPVFAGPAMAVPRHIGHTRAMSQQQSPVRELARLAWPVLVAQLAVVANGVFDTAMAGRLSAVDLAAVGIGSSVQATVLMSLMGVLLALPPSIAQLYG